MITALILLALHCQAIQGNVMFFFNINSFFKVQHSEYETFVTFKYFYNQFICENYKVQS